MSAQQTQEKLAAKKAAVIGSSSKSRAPLWAGLTCLAVLAAGGAPLVLAQHGLARLAVLHVELK